MLEDKKVNEIMLIMQEECAEVTQAISKCFRFGLNNAKPGIQMTNKEHLEGEIGDLLAMVDLLVDNNVISNAALTTAKTAKIAKLREWSNIYNKEAA